MGPPRTTLGNRDVHSEKSYSRTSSEQNSIIPHEPRDTNYPKDFKFFKNLGPNFSTTTPIVTNRQSNTPHRHLIPNGNGGDSYDNISNVQGDDSNNNEELSEDKHEENTPKPHKRQSPKLMRKLGELFSSDKVGIPTLFEVHTHS